MQGNSSCLVWRRKTILGNEHDGILEKQTCRKDDRFFYLFPGSKTEISSWKRPGKTHFWLTWSLTQVVFPIEESEEEMDCPDNW